MSGSVRVASGSDAAAIAEIYAPYVRDTAISFEEDPPSPGEMANRMAAVLENYPYLVFERGGEVLGYAYGGAYRQRAAYRWSVEVTAYVALSARGEGVGRALYAELLDLLTRQRFHSAFAGIALPNEPSVGFHEAMGFEYLGAYAEVGFKGGAWHDVGWWRRTLQDGLPSGDPVPFSALQVC